MTLWKIVKTNLKIYLLKNLLINLKKKKLKDNLKLKINTHPINKKKFHWKQKTKICLKSKIKTSNPKRMKKRKLRKTVRKMRKRMKKMRMMKRIRKMKRNLKKSYLILLQKKILKKNF
jgi:hypothetical protein